MTDFFFWNQEELERKFFDTFSTGGKSAGVLDHMMLNGQADVTSDDVEVGLC